VLATASALRHDACVRRLGRAGSRTGVQPDSSHGGADQVDRDEPGGAVMLSREWDVADAFRLIVNQRASPVAGED
jgi:hypothetical protein